MSEKLEEERFIVQEEEEGERLDVIIASRAFALSRSYVQKLIKNNAVLVSEKVRKSSYRPDIGEEITCTIPIQESSLIEPEDIPINISYEDEQLLVVDKPMGMVVHPAPGHKKGTLVNAVLGYLPKLSDVGGKIRPGIVHRLDKDTTGLLVVAKTDKAHIDLSDQFKNRTVKRKYIALVHGDFDTDKAFIDAPIGRDPNNRQKRAVSLKNTSKDARTHVVVKERFLYKDTKKYSLVDITLETGRTHQIRVHMAYIKRPVVGDSTYGYGSELELERQALHACSLGFTHPVSRQYTEFSSEPPDDIQRAIELLRKDK